MAVIALDFETNGLDYYSPTFRVDSVAIALRKDDGSIGTVFGNGAEEVRAILERVSKAGHKIVVHNAEFEWGIFKCCYPDLDLKPYCDTMRLVQQWGATGDPHHRTYEFEGYGLKKSLKRCQGMLDEFDNWEEPAFEYLRENHGAKPGKEREMLDLLPPELFKEYNVGDAIATLVLQEYLTSAFEDEGFDWEYDHGLYLFITEQMIHSRIRGIDLDRGRLERYLIELDEEVAEIDKKFQETFVEEIAQVRQKLLEKEQAKYKKKIVTELPEFNVGSNTQLEMLFCDVLGMQAKHFTPKNGPSFSSKHLKQWGEGGEILSNRKKRLIVKNQVLALLENSEGEGKIHPSFQVAGTVTGRYKVSSK